MSHADALNAIQERWVEDEIGRDWRRNQEKIGSIPNRCHAAGHPCMRRLVYDRTCPEEADPIDPGLFFIFREGRWLHDVVRRQLDAMGIEIESVERPVSWSNLELTGTIDFVLRIDGSSSVWDAKGYSPNTTIRDLDDIRRGPWYLQSAYWQVQLYKLLLGIEDGGFILKNKGSSRLRFLDVPLEYEEAEALLLKLEAINRHVAEGSIPDRTIGPQCDGCSFFRHCSPPVQHGGDIDLLIADGDLESAIDRYLETSETASENENLKGMIRETARKILADRNVTAAAIFGRKGGIRAKRSRNGALRMTPIVSGEEEGEDATP